MVKWRVETTGCREKGKIEVCICGRWEGEWGEERAWEKCIRRVWGVLFERFCKNSLGSSLRLTSRV